MSDKSKKSSISEVVMSPGVNLASPLSITASFHKMALANQARYSPITGDDSALDHVRDVTDRDPVDLHLLQFIDDLLNPLGPH